MTRVAIALVHHPVLDKEGNVFTTSLTNLDVHDIARSARTFGAAPYYIVTPITAQQKLARAIATFWDEGKGAARNPDRTEALRTVRVAASLDDALAEETKALGERPLVVATSAKRHEKNARFGDVRRRIREAKGALVVFGTGHGLAPSVLDEADLVLEPIYGKDPYNHLSVRSAVAVILDRLLSDER